MSRLFKRLSAVCALSSGILIAHSCTVAADGVTSFDQIERGRELARLGDCTACHTPPGGKPFAGGVEIQTPFGLLVGPNITPDPQTGIGTWSEGDFQRAMSEGINKEGKHLYNAMPVTAFTKVSPQDNAALWAYLQTIEPVNNAIEPNQLPFPFNVRASLYFWNILNFTPGRYVADDSKSSEWNRGAYIVQGLGHCGSCHTPKTLTGGDKDGEFLQGYNVENWHAPNITGDRHLGVGDWSIDEIAQYLKTGSNRFDIASGPMADEIKNSSQYWKESDLKAVAVYLRDLGDTKSVQSQPIDPSSPTMIAGKAIYADRCSACHVGNGEGTAHLFPRLANSPLVNSADPTSLIRVVLAGSRAGATTSSPTGPAMPAFAWNLNDKNVASVLTFIRNSWGNAAPDVTENDVKSLRQSLEH